MFRKLFIGQEKPLESVNFRLSVDESVMGMPRMMFVLMFGCIGVLAIGFCTLLITCYTQRKRRNNNYNFSLLPQRSEQQKLFEDDDDDVEETELFRSPIKGTKNSISFYDFDDKRLFCWKYSFFFFKVNYNRIMMTNVIQLWIRMS